MNSSLYDILPVLHVNDNLHDVLAGLDMRVPLVFITFQLQYRKLRHTTVICRPHKKEVPVAIAVCKPSEKTFS